MKKIIYLLWLLSFIFLTWCQSPQKWTNVLQENSLLEIQQVKSGLQTYQSKVGWFSVQYPSKWTFQENAYGSIVMFFAPTSEWDKIKENLSVIKEDTKKIITSEQYYQSSKELLVKSLTDFSEISNQNIKIDWIDAKKIIYKRTLWDTKLQVEQVLLIKDKAAYIFTYTATPETFDDYIKNIDQIINSFSID